MSADIEELNRRENIAFAGLDEARDFTTEDSCSLNPYRAIFQPPFLPLNEIRRRRFAEMRIRKKGQVQIVRLPDVILSVNDAWWEWQKDTPSVGEPFLVENTAPPPPQIADGKRKIYEHRCFMCKHEWKGVPDPRHCPKCESRLWRKG